MPEPEFNEMSKRLMRERAHELEHALRRVERDIRRAEHDKMHAIKDAIKRDARMCRGLARYEEMDEPRSNSIEDVLVEVDSYISYLEDLPKDRLAPYEDKIGRLAEHLDKVRASLKTEPK